MNPPGSSVVPFDWTYPLAFGWGLLVLVSLVGWGQTVGRWLLPNRDEEDLGWGLAAIWGMSAYLALSGPLIMLSLFSRTFVTLFILAGLVFMARHSRFLWKQCLSMWPRHWGVQALWIGLLLLMIFYYASAVAVHWYNSCDDFAAYFTHAKMLLDTGTYFDPFNFRLKGSLEGQQTLSILVVGFLPWKYTQMLDSGIAGLAVLGLMLGMVRGNNNQAWMARLLLVSIALTAYVPRINSASEITGVAFFTGLFCTFDRVSRHRALNWQLVFLLGSVVAATATLRCVYFFTVALLGFGFVVSRLWEGETKRRGVIREALMLLAGTSVLLASWWVVAYRTGGTFLYPLFQGTPSAVRLFQTFPSLTETLSFIGGFFFFTGYFLYFLPVLFMAAGRQQRAALIYGGVILLISIAMVAQFKMAIYEDISRYAIPIALAFALYSTGVVAHQIVTTSPFNKSAFLAARAMFAIIVAAAAVFLQSLSYYDVARQNMVLIEWALDARRDLISTDIVDFSKSAREDYPKAFAQIPPGSSVLIALDYPYLLDYRAHSIFSIDEAGGASPSPGFPYFQGTEPVKHYLLALGIRYIAHVPFERSAYLYSRSKQAQNEESPDPARRNSEKPITDFMNSIDQLAKTNPILYDSSTIRVIDLNSQAGSSK